MSARALWKAVLSFGEIGVPVKLYAAAVDRNIHFRLLHKKDRAPVRQVLVEPESGTPLALAEARRAYLTAQKDLVMLTPRELEGIQPKPSRKIELLRFLPPNTIDHRWYLRPYYLGPDSDLAAYRALVASLGRRDSVGLARWVMRNKDYTGVLRLHDGYPLLFTLRYQEEMVSLAQFEAPPGPALDSAELKLAQQLVSMLSSDFDPRTFRDEYRLRLRELIETKRQGGKLRSLRPRRRAGSTDLRSSLRKSVEKIEKSA